MEQQKMKILASDGTKYQNYLSDHAQRAVNDLSNKAQVALLSGNQDAREIVDSIQKINELKEQAVAKEERDFQKSLKLQKQSEKRSGYIRASILLYVVFIFGIFIACGLILFQK